MARPTVSAAKRHIERHGVLLLFPVDNRPEPMSLWSCFFPGVKMDWDWSEDGDGRVAELWHLREALSRQDDVAYTKWYRSRATFVSAEIFIALLNEVSPRDPDGYNMGIEARVILEVLEGDSPLPTKRLRNFCELEGKQFEREFNRGMRELWSRLLVVGQGEVEEGGFPSLAVGATRLLFEEFWDQARSLGSAEARRLIESKIDQRSLLGKNYKRFCDLFRNDGE